MKKSNESLLNVIPRHSETGAVLPNTNGWMTRHFDAVTMFAQQSPMIDGAPQQRQHERAVVLLVQGWLAYADAHGRAFDSLVGDDGVLGPAWKDIGESLRALLNGELGRLDGGVCDGLLLRAMKENGIDTELM